MYCHSTVIRSASTARPKGLHRRPVGLAIFNHVRDEARARKWMADQSPAYTRPAQVLVAAVDYGIPTRYAIALRKAHDSAPNWKELALARWRRGSPAMLKARMKVATWGIRPGAGWLPASRLESRQA